MIHAKFQDNRTSCSEEDDFKRFFHIWAWRLSIWTIYINFRSPFPERLHMKFDINWPSGFREADV